MSPKDKSFGHSESDDDVALLKGYVPIFFLSRVSMCNLSCENNKYR